MTYSEFGRRVAQNGSGGTITAPRHRTSWPAEECAGACTDNVHRSNLDGGDLKYGIDGRRL